MSFNVGENIRVKTIFCGYMPPAASGMVEDYKSAATMAGCTWQELVVYDTVRFENDLTDVDPYLSAMDFLKMYYEIWKYVQTEDGGYWKLVTSGNLNTPQSIATWFGLPADSDIKAVMDKAKGYTRPEFVVQFSPKELDDLIAEKDFSGEQIEWADMLMTSGALEQMFGDVYDLPDYIESAGSGYFGWPTPELHSVTSKYNTKWCAFRSSTFNSLIVKKYRLGGWRMGNYILLLWVCFVLCTIILLTLLMPEAIKAAKLYIKKRNRLDKTNHSGIW